MSIKASTHFILKLRKSCKIDAGGMRSDIDLDLSGGVKDQRLSITYVLFINNFCRPGSKDVPPEDPLKKPIIKDFIKLFKDGVTACNASANDEKLDETSRRALNNFVRIMNSMCSFMPVK
jgi:hypothetical protein